MLKKGDVILVLLIVFGVSLGAIANGGNNTDSLAIWKDINNPGAGNIIAVVRKDGEVIKTINLTKLKNREILKIPGQYNETVIADNKRICFASSDCPDQECVKTGWINKPGQVAICLPGRASISILSSNSKENNADGVDK